MSAELIKLIRSHHFNIAVIQDPVDRMLNTISRLFDSAAESIDATGLVLLIRKLYKALPAKSITEDELSAIEPFAQKGIDMVGDGFHLTKQDFKTLLTTSPFCKILPVGLLDQYRLKVGNPVHALLAYCDLEGCS